MTAIFPHDHACCSMKWSVVRDKWGGRIAPTKGQCDCDCHEVEAHCEEHGLVAK